MTTPSRPGSARVTTFVAVDPSDAFEVFTEEIDRWWGRGPRFRSARGAGVLRFELQGERRLVEVHEDGEVRTIGRVLVWEPNARLVFELHLPPPNLPASVTPPLR